MNFLLCGVALGCICEDGLEGGGGVWGDAHLRLTQNFAYTPYPTTTLQPFRRACSSRPANLQEV
jgi:hypothetical protein